MGLVIRTFRQWLYVMTMLVVCLALQAAGSEFWTSKEPASWTGEEKQVMLNQSPWAREGSARMELDDRRKTPGYGTGGVGSGMPDIRPGAPAGGVPSVPIGEAPPKPPNPDPGRPVEFHVLARWETATPVRLAGGPEVPAGSGQFYVIRLRGLPLMPPPKNKPEEPATDPNEAILQAIQAGSRLERKGQPAISCAHLFKGSGGMAAEVLLFFPRGSDPITAADKFVTLESRFGLFHLSIRFPLKAMMFRGQLAL